MNKIVIGLLGILCVGLIILLAFGVEVGSLKWKGYFAPKHEAVRREVFKQTRSYNEGKEQELVKMRYEYMTEKDNDTKEAILSTVRHSFGDYDENLIESAELRTFLKTAKYGK